MLFFPQFLTNQYRKNIHVDIVLFNNIFKSHCPALFRAHPPKKSSHLALKSVVTQILCPSTPSLLYSQPFPQQPQRQIWKISIYGTSVAVTCLIGSKQALICHRLASLLSTTSKFEIDFCLELKGLRPFHCLSSVCVYVYTCLCMQL